jgi:hypothetical protein
MIAKLTFHRIVLAFGGAYIVGLDSEMKRLIVIIGELNTKCVVVSMFWFLSLHRFNRTKG